MLARRILLNPVVRGYSKGRLANVMPADVKTVGDNYEADIEAQLNPDRNFEYVCTIHDPLPARPAWLGLEGTELHALRARESGNWGDFTADEQRALYRGYVNQTIPETLQKTDMWKGIAGLVFLGFAAVNLIFYYSFRYVHREKSGESGLWYQWQPGWQQHRKNQAAYHIFFENETIEGRNDQHEWNYDTHQWRAPQWVRFDNHE